MNVTFILFLRFMIVTSDLFVCGSMRVVPEVILGTVVFRVLHIIVFYEVFFTFGISFGLFWGSSHGLENSYPVKNDIY